jgi:cytochrome c biogenesis protein CcmG/thiol:disulfide interchange protein DsbE
MTSLEARPEAKPGRSPWLIILPVAIFLALAAVFAFALRSGDPSRLPSALIGKSVPAFALPPIDGLVTPAGQPVPGFGQAELSEGDVRIVNVWASWCAPCHQEHPHLIELGRVTGVPILGLNYKDRADDARRFLGRYGNPFTAVGADATGRTAIEWGVYGVPETFVVGGDGRILYKHVGALTPQVIGERLLPVIAKARAAK